MRRETESLEIVQGVYFEIIHLLKNSGTKDMLIFDDFGEETGNSKAIAVFSTTRRHRGLTTIYEQHIVSSK